jgi:hypothetical protein
MKGARRTHEKKKNAYKILVRKPERDTLGRPRHRWKDNIRTNLREIGCKGVGLIYLI